MCVYLECCYVFQKTELSRAGGHPDRYVDGHREQILDYSKIGLWCCCCWSERLQELVVSPNVHLFRPACGFKFILSTEDLSWIFC